MNNPHSPFDPHASDFVAENFSEEWLSAYLDDELPQPQRQIVEQRLQEDPGMRETLADIERIRKLVADLPKWSSTDSIDIAAITSGEPRENPSSTQTQLDESPSSPAATSATSPPADALVESSVPPAEEPDATPPLADTSSSDSGALGEQPQSIRSTFDDDQRVQSTLRDDPESPSGPSPPPGSVPTSAAAGETQSPGGPSELDAGSDEVAQPAATASPNEYQEQPDRVDAIILPADSERAVAMAHPARRTPVSFGAHIGWWRPLALACSLLLILGIGYVIWDQRPTTSVASKSAADSEPAAPESAPAAGSGQAVDSRLGESLQPPASTRFFYAEPDPQASAVGKSPPGSPEQQPQMLSLESQAPPATVAPAATEAELSRLDRGQNSAGGLGGSSAEDAPAAPSLSQADSVSALAGDSAAIAERSATMGRSATVDHPVLIARSEAWQESELPGGLVSAAPMLGLPVDQLRRAMDIAPHTTSAAEIGLISLAGTLPEAVLRDIEQQLPGLQYSQTISSTALSKNFASRPADAGELAPNKAAPRDASADGLALEPSRDVLQFNQSRRPGASVEATPGSQANSNATSLLLFVDRGQAQQILSHLNSRSDNSVIPMWLQRTSAAVGDRAAGGEKSPQDQVMLLIRTAP